MMKNRGKREERKGKKIIVTTHVANPTFCQQG